jgi:hypothetical protein
MKSTRVHSEKKLEMAGMMVVWVVLESCQQLRQTLGTLFSNNSPTVSWTESLMSQMEHHTSARFTLVAALDAGCAAIASATVDFPAWLHDWKMWEQYSRQQGHTSPYLEDCSPMA